MRLNKNWPVGPGLLVFIHSHKNYLLKRNEIQIKWKWFQEIEVKICPLRRLTFDDISHPPKDTRRSLLSTLSKIQTKLHTFPQLFDHIFLLMSRKYVSVANEKYVPDQGKLFLMVAWLSTVSISCFNVQSSIGNLVCFFNSGNSVVSGVNPWCRYWPMINCGNAFVHTRLVEVYNCAENVAWAKHKNNLKYLVAFIKHMK